MKTTKLLFKLFFLGFILLSCEKDEEVSLSAKEIQEILISNQTELKEKFDKSIVISSEGNFGDKDGSIALISSDFSYATNFIYDRINGAQLGALVQSITFNDSDAFIILNDAHTVVVVDRNTFEKKAVITSGFNNPRYMTVIGEKGYVTNWGNTASETDDFIAVIDLNTNTVSNTIPVDLGPERILSVNEKLFVTHKGAYGVNNIVSVIDTNTNNSINTIIVKDTPDDMVVNSVGNLMVLSEGNIVADYSNWPEVSVLSQTLASISTIDVNSNSIISEIVFPEGDHPSLMDLDNGKLFYFLSDKVYEMTESATSLPAGGFSVGDIYGMTVRDGLLYTVDYAFEYLSKLSVIDIATEDKLYTAKVGLGASKIYFNE